MKISKQLLLITSTLFIFFASGCSKNLSPTVDVAPDADFFKEENVGEFDTSSDPEDIGKEGNGLLSEGGDKDKTPDDPEPFLPENGGDTIDSLSQEEEAHRRLPYRPSDHLSDIFFAFDMYDLDNQLLATLQENADYLKSHPFSKIVIQGHCDERGSNNYNISLGEQRANSVKSYLILLGVDESRIHTVSYGEEKPFCFENNEKCWHQNRRVSFIVAEYKRAPPSPKEDNAKVLEMLEKDDSPQRPEGP